MLHFFIRYSLFIIQHSKTLLYSTFPGAGQIFNFSKKMINASSVMTALAVKYFFI